MAHLPSLEGEAEADGEAIAANGGVGGSSSQRQFFEAKSARGARVQLEDMEEDEDEGEGLGQSGLNNTSKGLGQSVCFAATAFM